MQHGKGGYKDEKDENLMPQWWENEVQGFERAKLIPPERFEPIDSNSVDRLLGIDFESDHRHLKGIKDDVKRKLFCTWYTHKINAQ